MQGEGLKLASDTQWTYICQIGGSTIDVILVRGFTKLKHEPLWNAEGPLIRKHIPVVTTITGKEIKRKENSLPKKKVRKTVDMEQFTSNISNMDEVRRLIRNNELDEAIGYIGNWIKGAAREIRARRGKRWFDKECYKERKRTLTSLHLVKELRNKEALEKYHNARNRYKNLIKEKKKTYLEE